MSDAELRIVMSARAVVSSGAPFSRWGKPFSDPDVALDEIVALRPQGEPVVLRVEAQGGTVSERLKVDGDWLCLADGSEPRSIPEARWSYNRAASQWAHRLAWLDAWERCEDARWMLHAAAAARVDRRLIVLAQCACARTVLRIVPDREKRPLLVIAATEAWARDRTTMDHVRVATREASYAGIGGRAVDSATYAAASCGGYASGRANSATEPVEAAAEAEVYDSEAGGRPANPEARARALLKMAALVRANISTLDVLMAAVASSQ